MWFWENPFFAPMAKLEYFFNSHQVCVPPTYSTKSKSHRVRIRQRTNTQSHRFFTISFILLPNTIVSFGGLPNNKSKWGWLIMQGCQKIRTNINRNLIRELVRRFFFHWYIMSKAACWIVQIVSRESSETWAYAKKCWKIEIFIAFCWNI